MSTNADQPYTTYSRDPEISLKAPIAFSIPPPTTTTTTPALLSTANHVELDTNTTPVFTPQPYPKRPITHTTPLLTQFLTAPSPYPWILDAPARLAHLIQAREVSTRLLSAAYAEVLFQTVNLAQIEEGITTLSYARVPKGQGSDHECKKNFAQGGSEQSRPVSSGGSAALPAFMCEYLPAPDHEPNPIDGTLGTKRCAVGRLVGKVLWPGEDRYYQLGR